MAVPAPLGRVWMRITEIFQCVCQVKWGKLLIRKCVEGRPAGRCSSTHPLLINTHPTLICTRTCTSTVTISGECLWVSNLKLKKNKISQVFELTSLTVHQVIFQGEFQSANRIINIHSQISSPFSLGMFLLRIQSNK